MNSVDRAGNFRGIISEYGLKKMDSGAVGVTIRVLIEEMWDQENQAWVDWQYDMEAVGDIWIIGNKEKGNKINERAARSLIQYAGWDGNIASIVTNEWQPSKVHVSVSREEYKGNVHFKISFVNDYDRPPGGLVSNVSADEAKQMAAVYGSSLRALAGTVRANGSKPNGNAPPTPPARKPAPVQEPLPQRAHDPVGEEIPF